MQRRVGLLAVVALACSHEPAPRLPTPTTPAAAEGVQLTRPAATADAWVEELGFLEQLVETWWASREEHERLDRIDVPSIFATARRRAQSCDELACHAEIVRSTLCALGDGHLRIEPEWWLPYNRYRSGARFVLTTTGVRAASAGGGIEIGDRLVAVDGQPVEGYLATSCEQPGSTPAQRRHLALEALSRRARFGDPPPPLELEIEGQERHVVLAWEPADGGGDPPACVDGRKLDATTAYLRVGTFWCGGNAGAFREQLRVAIDKLSPTHQLIVDLRDNSGGMDEPARWLASALIRRRAEWMRFRHPRPYDEQRPFAREFIDPDPSALKNAKLYFLIGPGCFSTCDTFASVFRAPDVADATFVGQPTAGGVGNPTRFRLPYSGLTVSIPVSLYAMPGQDRDILIEGRGVTADIPVLTSLDDLRAGRDAALEAAVKSNHEAISKP